MCKTLDLGRPIRHKHSVRLQQRPACHCQSHRQRQPDPRRHPHVARTVYARQEPLCLSDTSEAGSHRHDEDLGKCF